MDAHEIEKALADNAWAIRWTVRRFASLHSRIPELRDLDEALQIGNIAAWRACLTWSSDGGAKLSSHIVNAVRWSMHQTIQHWKHRKRAGTTCTLEDGTDPGREHRWPDLDRGAFWRKIRNRIGKRDTRILYWRFVEHRRLSDIGASCGFRRQWIEQIIKRRLSDLQCVFRNEV